MHAHSKPVRALAALLAAFAALALPAGVLAATPLSVTTTTSTTATVTPATTTTSTASTAAPITIPTGASSGLSTLQYVGIGVVAIAVFATIIYVIRRDAHVHAPRHATREIDTQRGTVAPRAERVKRSRAKAKAARRARRRSGR